MTGLTHSNYPDVSGSVIFLRSFTEHQRSVLLDRCSTVLYTPSNEHFGIVPVECMYARRPVIACNNGGPLESVKHRVTGMCEYACVHAYMCVVRCTCIFVLVGVRVV